MKKKHGMLGIYILKFYRLTHTRKTSFGGKRERFWGTKKLHFILLRFFHHDIYREH